MEASDITQDEADDILISNGDFVIGLSDQQHIEDIILAFTGWWKEFPSMGVGIQQYVNGPGTEQKIEQSIKLQLQQDGYDVSGTRVSFGSDGKLQIAPNAIRN